MDKLRKHFENLAWLLHGPPDAEAILRARAWAGHREHEPVCRPRAVETRGDDSRLEAIANALVQRLTAHQLDALRRPAPRLRALLLQLRDGPRHAARVRTLLREAELERRELDDAARVLDRGDGNGHLGLLLAHASLA